MADSANKRNIPIKLGDFSVIDTEFSRFKKVKKVNIHQYN